MVAEAAVGVGLGKTMGRLIEDKAIVRQLFAQVCYLSCSLDNGCLYGPMANDLRTDGVVTLLTHGLVDSGGVCLLLHKEEFLAVV